jgi:hypothetical protein
LPDKSVNTEDSHSWNLVAHASGRDGQINVNDDAGNRSMSSIFAARVTTITISTTAGCRETVLRLAMGTRPFPGRDRRFFTDIRNTAEAEATTKTFTVRNDELRDQDASYEERNFARDKCRHQTSAAFDLRYRR